MPRKPHSGPEPLPDTLDRDALREDTHALNEMARRSSEVALRFGDGMPYERHRVVAEARFFMTSAAEAMLELGKRLVQIKENEPHGEFLQIVEGLGIAERSARRMMAASIKFLAPALEAKRATLATLGRAKLFDLMTEDEGDIAALADGGTLAGLTLDDMQTMSMRELREALVEARRRLDAKDKVIERKEAKLSELEESIAARDTPQPDEAEAQQLEGLRNQALLAEGALLRLVHEVDAVMQAPATSAAELAARHTVQWIVQRLADACLERQITVDLGERVAPLWAAPIDEIAAQHATAPARGRKRGNASRS
jgi:hypothetical protein